MLVKCLPKEEEIIEGDLYPGAIQLLEKVETKRDEWPGCWIWLGYNVHAVQPGDESDERFARLVDAMLPIRLTPEHYGWRFGSDLVIPRSKFFYNYTSRYSWGVFLGTVGELVDDILSRAMIWGFTPNTFLVANARADDETLLQLYEVGVAKGAPTDNLYLLYHYNAHLPAWEKLPDDAVLYEGKRTFLLRPFSAVAEEESQLLHEISSNENTQDAEAWGSASERLMYWLAEAKARFLEHANTEEATQCPKTGERCLRHARTIPVTPGEGGFE